MLPALTTTYAVAFLVILAAEAYALLQRVDYGTFSEWAQRTFVAIYGMGLLAGHVVLAPKSPWLSWQMSIVVIVGGLLFTLLTTQQTAEWNPRQSPNTFRLLRAAVFAVGLICGWVAWPLP